MCASSTPLARIAQGLGSSDFYLISSLGVAQTTKKEWRYLPSAFCGMGLYNIATKTIAATINSFLQHYNMSTSIGVTLQACLENLQLELGVPDNPLLYNFSIWSVLATDSWIKSLWEKIQAYKIDINMDYKKHYTTQNTRCVYYDPQPFGS